MRCSDKSGMLVAAQRTSRQGALPARSLDRVFVAEDGRIKALFSDNTVIYLTSNAQSFLHIAPYGKRTSQLSEYCLSRLTPLLSQILTFRNSFATDHPFYPRCLLQQLPASSIFALGYPLQELCWPATVVLAFKKSLVQLNQDGSLHLHSSCGYATLTLEPHQQRFTISYPLLLSNPPSSRSSASSYTYTTHVQTFSTSSCPERWQPPLSLARAIAANSAVGFKLTQASISSPKSHPSPPRTSRTPSRTLCSKSPFTCSPTCTRTYPWPHPPHSPTRLCSSISNSPCCSHSQQPTYLTHIVTPLPVNIAATATGTHCTPPTKPAATPAAPATGLPSSSCSSTGWEPPTKPAAATPAASAAGLRGITCTTAGPSPRGSNWWQPAVPPTPPAAAVAGACGISSSRCSSGAVAGSLAEVLGSSSWWYEASPALPRDQVLQMMWTPAATYIFDQVSQEVQVWVHADDSVMVSQQKGAFFNHFLPGEEDPRGYVATAPPEFVTSQATGQRLMVGGLVATAFKFRHAMVATTAAQVSSLHSSFEASRPFTPAAAAGRDTPLKRLLPGGPPAAAAGAGAWGPLVVTEEQISSRGGWLGRSLADQELVQGLSMSSDVVEDQEVEGLGRFVAYADGRVKATFCDRTILTMDAGKERCRLLMPDGKWAEASVANPVGVEGYVQAACEFATWTSKSPAQRAQELRLAALVEAQLKASQRMAAICGWASQGELPVAAALEALENHYHQPEQQQQGQQLLLSQAGGAAAARGTPDAEGWGHRGSLDARHSSSLQQQQEQQEQEEQQRQAVLRVNECQLPSPPPHWEEAQEQQQQQRKGWGSSTGSLPSQHAYQDQQRQQQQEEDDYQARPELWCAQQGGSCGVVTDSTGWREVHGDAGDLLQELSLEQLEQELRLLEKECPGGSRSSMTSLSSSGHGGGSTAAGGGATLELWGRVVMGTAGEVPVLGVHGKQGVGASGAAGCMWQSEQGAEEGLHGWQGVDVGPPPPWELVSRRRSSRSGGVAAARQAAVEEMLARNALLLQKL